MINWPTKRRVDMDAELKDLKLQEVIDRFHIWGFETGHLSFGNPEAVLKSIWGPIWDNPKMQRAYMQARYDASLLEDFELFDWLIEAGHFPTYIRVILEDGGLEGLMRSLRDIYWWWFKRYPDVKRWIREAVSFHLVDLLNEKFEGDRSAIKAGLREEFVSSWIAQNNCRELINAAYNQIVLRHE